MKNKYLLLGLVVWLVIHVDLLYGQSTYKISYDAPEDQFVEYLEVLSDGSALIAGRSTNGPAGGMDALLVKVDATGNVEWAKTYGGSGNDNFSAVKSTSDGGFMAVGNRGGDAFVVKTDGGGGINWQRTFGAGGNDELRNVTETPGGDFIFTGYTFANGSSQGYVVRTDNGGNTLWTHVSNVAGIFGEPILNAAGEILFGAGINGDGSFIRMDANGNIVANTRLQGASTEAFYHIEAGGSGYVVSDHSWSFGGGTMQSWLSKFTATGSLQWSKTYDVNNLNTRAVVEGTPDGGFIFAPWYNTGNYAEAILVKLDVVGSIIWAKSYAFEGNGKLRHAKPVVGGGYLAAGHVSGSGTNGFDVFVLRTDGDGEIDNACCSQPAPVSVQTVSPVIGGTSFSPTTLQNTLVPSDGPIDLSAAPEDRCWGPNCCVTDAGTMVAGDLNVCVPDTAIATHAGDEVLESGDLLQFILYTDPADPLGSIVSINNSPVFPYDPGLYSPGVAYYVAAIAGNNVGGSVDYNDPCFDISDAVTVSWQPAPEISLQSAPSICEGNCADVQATLVGMPPFVFAWQWLQNGIPVGTTTTEQTTSNTYVFTACPPPGAGFFELCVVTLSDLYCD